jgi:hypothetical protein
MEHEPQVFELNRTYSSSIVESFSRDLKCDVCHTQLTCCQVFHHLLRMNQFQMPWDMTLPVVPVQTLQTSSASSLPQRTCSLGLNEYLGCRGLILGGLCCKEMMVVDLIPGGLVSTEA